MFILAGFIHHLTQLFRYVEAVKGDFINCTVSGCARLLYSPHSCPLRAF
jgi:hypothetical protein